MKKLALSIALGTLALAAPTLVRAADGDAPAKAAPAPKKEAKGKKAKGDKKDDAKKDDAKKDDKPAGGGW
jgi:hypothetical protein